MAAALSNYTQVIIQSLDVLRKRDVANKKPFSARAYAKVITELKEHKEPITSYEDVCMIKGIGAKIQEKIKEILETGELQSAERAKELYALDALDALQQIYGVGPSKATDLVGMGILSIAQLRKEVKEHPKLLNDKQKIGLEYYEDLLQRIPRNEMMQHREILQSSLPDEMKEYDTDLVGSFRREAETSGDIDVLIRVPKNVLPKFSKKNLTMYVEHLKQLGYIEEILALGEHKCMAICRIQDLPARRLDLLMTPDTEYAYSLLYFTGSDRFNVGFRQYTLEKGYTLNEHTLTPLRNDVPEPPYMKTEKDIFQFMKLKYVEPNHRIDGSQILPMKVKPSLI